MLAIIIKIKSIDYEETLKGIFPLVTEEIGQLNSGHWVIQLIRSLGDKAQTVASGVLRRLQNDLKDELLVRCVNAYERVLTCKANDELNKRYGSCFKIGALLMERDEGLYLQIRQVQVAYVSLPDLLFGHANPLLRMVEAAAGRIGYGSFEATALELIRQNESKRKLLSGIQTFLNQNGIIVQLEDMDVAEEPGVSFPSFRTDFVLNENLTTALCGALAGYLGDLLAVARGNERLP